MVAGEVRLARKIPEIGKNEARRRARIAANTDNYCDKVLFLTEHCQYLCGRLQTPPLSGKALPMKLFLTLAGLILILEGLPYAASPETMQRWLRQILEMRPEQLRAVGFVAMAGGFFLCFLARQSGLFP